MQKLSLQVPVCEKTIIIKNVSIKVVMNDIYLKGATCPLYHLDSIIFLQFFVSLLVVFSILYFFVILTTHKMNKYKHLHMNMVTSIHQGFITCVFFFVLLGCRFINLQVSSLTDKWYGESQKLAAAVFSLVRIIMFDLYLLTSNFNKIMLKYCLFV